MFTGQSSEIGHGTTPVSSGAEPAIDVMGVTGLDMQPANLEES